MRSSCSFNNCEKPVVGRGWCNRHYLQARKFGAPRLTSRDPNPAYIKGRVAFLSLLDKTGRKVATTKVNVDDLAGVQAYRWHLHPTGYVTSIRYARETKTAGHLHRFLMGTPERGKEVDHINRDRLDNRRSNLRFATRSQNAVNRVKRAKGVYKEGSRWRAYVKKGQKLTTKSFGTKREALVWRTERMREMFSEFAR